MSHRGFQKVGDLDWRLKRCSGFRDSSVLAPLPGTSSPTFIPARLPPVLFSVLFIFLVALMAPSNHILACTWHTQGLGYVFFCGTELRPVPISVLGLTRANKEKPMGKERKNANLPMAQKAPRKGSRERNDRPLAQCTQPTELHRLPLVTNLLEEPCLAPPDNGRADQQQTGSWTQLSLTV